MAQVRQKGVSTKHPDFIEHSGTWTRCQDAADGEAAIHAGLTKYLSKLHKEKKSDYDARRKRTPFFNATWRTISGLKGMLFRKPAKVEVPQSIEDNLLDIDLAGTPLDIFVQDLSREILTVGRVGILADFPNATPDDSRTVAEATELGLRPMLQKYKAREVINWKTERINNVVRYTLVVMTELTDLTGKDEYEQKTELRYRVLDLVWAKGADDEEPQRVYRQRVYTTDGKGNDVKVGEDIFPMMNNKRMNEIPFFFVGVENMGAGVDLPPLLDLIDMNLHHYTVSADYEHGCHMSGLPTLFITGWTPEENQEIYIGGAAANVLKDSEADAKYVEVEGNYAGLRENLNSKKNEMAILGARMLEEQKQAVESDKTQRQRVAGEQSQLATMAQVLSMAISKALKIFAEFAGSDDKVSYEINTDFVPEGMTPEELTALVAAWQSGAFSKQVLFDALKQGEIIDHETTFEDEQERIASQSPPAPNEAGNDET